MTSHKQEENRIHNWVDNANLSFALSKASDLWWINDCKQGDCPNISFVTVKTER